MQDHFIIVATHKLFDDTILPEGYHVIKVGNKDFKIPSGWEQDNTKENISNKNNYYCELTAQYWVWKNSDLSNNSILGLTHYRRYFFNYKKKSLSWEEDILNCKDIEKILSKKKIIMSIPSVKLKGFGRLYKKKDNSNEKHWVLMEDIIKNYFPDYLKSFEKVLYGKYVIWGNMFITTKNIFDDYSKWLFDILNIFDKKIKENNDSLIPREDGFLAEYLLMVYMYKNFNAKDIYRLEVRNTESDNFSEYKRKNFKSFCIRFIRKHRFLLLTARRLRIFYLLWKRK